MYSKTALSIPFFIYLTSVASLPLQPEPSTRTDCQTQAGQVEGSSCFISGLSRDQPIPVASTELDFEETSWVILDITKSREEVANLKYDEPSVASPLASTSKISSVISTAADDNTEPEDNEDDNAGDNSFLALPPRTRRGFSIATVVLASITVLLLLSYTIYTYPPSSYLTSLRHFCASILSFFATFTSSVRAYLPFTPSFRVGESRLVRWAHEDLGLLDLENERDVDVMVNGARTFEIDDGLDEGIPLKPSPGLRRGVVNYGSAWR